MKRIFSILFALVLAVSLLLVPAAPAAVIANGNGNTLEVSKWTEHVANPIFDPVAKAYYPTVVKLSNRDYRMWYGSDSGVGHATSPDGLTWTEVSNPVSGLATNANHPLVEYIDGKFSIWYWDTGVSIYGISALRYAESSDGINWSDDQALTQYTSYKLITGAGTGWNRGSYGPGDVIYNPDGSNSLVDSNIWDNKYVIYYMATNGNNEYIGLGYSVDGKHWKRYGDDPVLSPCTEANNPSAGWDYRSVGYPTVMKDADGIWHMWFCGGPTTNHGIGYAWSNDGISWTKVSNPIFHKDDGVSWRANRTYCPMVIEEGGIYKMWFSGKDSATSNYAIGYATADGPFPTIQSAIDAASAGDTINVAAGTYDEQVVIDKSLTLQGAGDTTIIQPAGPELTATASIPWIGSTKPMSAIVSVETTGDEVTIRDLKIDGSLITSKSTLWVGGLVYLETSGKVEGVTVIGNPALPDRTAGIFAAAVTQTSLVEVTGCNVIGYNRAGIYALGAEFTADYHHNEINGPGSISTGVPNGMFFLEGATGSATYNTVTDLGYTGETYRSTGIGTYNAGTGITFSYNTISNVQNAFALSTGTSGTIVEYNNIFNNHTGVRIEADATNSIIQYNNIHDNDFAIRCGPDMGNGNEAHYNNFVDNPGLEWTNVGEGCTYVGAVCNLHETYDLDAECNWWGDCSGPGVVGPGTGDTVSADVDYDPWLGKALCELRDAIDELEDDGFTKPKAADDRRQALLDKIDAVCDQYDDGSYRGAIKKLERDVTKRIEKWIDDSGWLIDMVDEEITILSNFVQ